MRLRTVFGMFALVAVVGISTITARGNGYVGTDTQWTVVNFQEPVLVKREFIMGSVLIIHDSTKMAQGKPCTTFYRFDPGRGPQEALVSFHCKPRRAGTVATSTFTTVSTEPGCKRLVEYQIAGDSEAHGVPVQ